MSHTLYLLCKSNEISYVLTCRSVNNIVYILYKAFNNSSQYYDFVIYYLNIVQLKLF